MPFVTEDGVRVDPLLSDEEIGASCPVILAARTPHGALITVSICTVVYVTWIKPIHDHQSMVLSG